MLKWSNTTAESVWKEILKNSSQMLTGLTPTAVKNVEDHIRALEKDREKLAELRDKLRSMELREEELKKRIILWATTAMDLRDVMEVVQDE